MEKKVGYAYAIDSKDELAQQVTTLQAAGCDDVFTDYGRVRQGLRRALRVVQPGDVFIVVGVECAFRSVPDALSELAKLQSRGVRFQSLSQDFDLTTPEGKLQFTLTAAMAAWNTRRSACAPNKASPPRG